MVNLVSYGAGILGFLFFFFKFIDTRRCFIRGSEGAGGNPRMGVDFNYTMGDLLSCYAYWAFSSWLVALLLGMVGIVMFLKAQHAYPTKIAAFFVGYILAMHFLLSFTTAKEAHTGLVGG